MPSNHGIESGNKQRLRFKHGRNALERGKHRSLQDVMCCGLKKTQLTIWPLLQRSQKFSVKSRYIRKLYNHCRIAPPVYMLAFKLVSFTVRRLKTDNAESVLHDTCDMDASIFVKEREDLLEDGISTEVSEKVVVLLLY